MLVSPLCDFTKPTIKFINLRYAPLDEYIYVLDRLRTDCDQDDLRYSVFKRFKQLLSRLLSGLPIEDDKLEDTLKFCKQTRLSHQFLANPKTLYQLVQFIEINKIIRKSITRIFESEIKEVAIFCKDIEQWKLICSLVDEHERDFIYPVYRATIRKNYINGPLFIIAPSYWISDFLKYPSAETVYIIQPSSVGIPELKMDLFKCNTEIDIGLVNTSMISTSINKLIIEASDDYKNRVKITPIVEPFSFKSMKEILGTLSHITCKEVLGQDGSVNYIQTNKTYITISNDGLVENKIFGENDNFHGTSYIVQNIDYSKMSHEDVNQEYRKQMEKWKKPLRDYYRPYELPHLLKDLGAKIANEQNIKNWSKTVTIAPKGRADFLAVLTFANIKSEEEIETFFKLARNMRSNSISLGHKKADVAKEIIKKAIMSKLSNREPLENELSIGNLNAEIFMLKNN
nr:hypothetical protein [Moritella viscosa]SHO13436.1 DNA-directed RNA polymerase subunit beta-RNA polymerase subunit beta-Transcriptase subunit beta [Moritella viscosa]